MEDTRENSDLQWRENPGEAWVEPVVGMQSSDDRNGIGKRSPGPSRMDTQRRSGLATLQAMLAPSAARGMCHEGHLSRACVQFAVLLNRARGPPR